MIESPESVEELDLGEVQLRIYHYNNPIHNSYTIRIGVAVVPLTENDMHNLTELLTQYATDYLTEHNTVPWWKVWRHK